MKQSIIYLSLVLLFTSCKRHVTTSTIVPINRNFLEEKNGRSMSVCEVANLPELPSRPIVIRVPEHPEACALKDYVSSFHYIPLETSDSSLIGQITKICSDDSLLFVFDRKNGIALRFSSQGKYLGKIGNKGRGPGEFINPYDMSMNRSKKEICLLDLNGGKQIFYDYKGMLLREQPLYFYYDKMEFVDDMQVVSTSYANNSTIPAIDAHRMVVAAADQMPLFRAFPFPSGLRENFHWETESPLQTCGDKLYYNYITSDTIWTISASGYYPSYILDFGRPNPFVKKEGEQPLDDEGFRTIAGNNMFFPGMYLQTKDVAYFQVSERGRFIKPLFYHKRSGNILYGFSPSTEEDGLQSFFLSGVFDFTLNDTSFVCVLEPFRLIKWLGEMKKHNMPVHLTPQDEDLLNTLEVEDNPVLAVINLKSF